MKNGNTHTFHKNLSQNNRCQEQKINQKIENILFRDDVILSNADKLISSTTNIVEMNLKKDDYDRWALNNKKYCIRAIDSESFKDIGIRNEIFVLSPEL